jgi:BirA family biotin operon repressor/biotin-[acetyl-CoA-carboxylase] ligase
MRLMSFGETLRAWLPAGRLGQTLYAYDDVGSTNDVALELARAGAVEGTLVVADHQFRGRGRGVSRWVSPPGESIAMSMIFRPTGFGPRWSGMGGLAVVEALAERRIEARIKWPNDVLIGDRKVAGVLVEAAWEGDDPASVVLGIGVNLGARSAPPDERVDFPATSIEASAGRGVGRAELIAGIVRSLERWSQRIESREFLAAWERLLAFRGRRVRVGLAGAVVEGVLEGLDDDGSVILRLESGSSARCGPESAHLRPL